MSVGAQECVVGAPTYRPRETAVADVPADGWVAVRQAGKLLFEYHPERSWSGVVRRQRPFVVDLKGIRLSYSMPSAP
ncbi:MAG: hypothetical protein IPJ94_19545 [Chloroflexi bacterium]|nr:hypothetical protein [Chloroflexota bacterium]